MKILLGGYEEIFCAGLRIILKDFREEVYLFESKSIEDFRNHCCDGYDLILFDPSSPGWLGIANISNVRKLSSNTPLVILPATGELCDVRQALKNGASAYIPRSSNSILLKAVLDLVLNGGTYAPPIEIIENVDQSNSRINRCIVDGLTPRQLDVFKALRTGQSNKQIAFELGLSEGTVKIHMSAIFKFLGVNNRTQAVLNVDN